MAIDYAVWVYNRIPDMNFGLSALKYGKCEGLSQCQKPFKNVMFGVVQHMF